MRVSITQYLNPVEKHTSGMPILSKLPTFGSGCCCTIGAAGADVGCCCVAVVALTPFLKELGCCGVIGVDGVGVGGGSASDDGVAAVLALAAAAPFFVGRYELVNRLRDNK